MAKAYSYIRFSTAGQIEGRSLQRQLESAQKYADENGLELQPLSFQDLGVSGFKGKNSEQGALSEFIEAVKEGAIESGSWLLLESFDRMSRQPVNKSLRLLMELVEELGINLVTLMDRQVYKKGQLDTTKLVISLVMMSRAHEESVTKSKRLSDVWQSKQALASEKLMGSPLPAWLEYNHDRSQIIITAKAAIVKYIFLLCAEGYGREALVKRLIADRIKPIGKRAKQWHKSYISKLLNNRSVLGEYIPHRTCSTGKREPTGKVIKDYYPRIIDDDLWHKARGAIQNRRKGSTGINRNGFTRNIFTGFIQCECGSSMNFVNKGSSDKGGYYLVCSAGRYGMGCGYKSHRYYSVQWVILIALQKMLSPFSSSTSSDATAQTLEGKISELRGQAENLVTDLSENGYSQFVSQRLREVEKEIGKLEKELEELRDQEVLQNESIDIQELTANINDQQERLRLHQYLKRRIKSIILYKCKSKIVINALNNQVIKLIYSDEEDLWISDTGLKFKVEFDTRWGLLK